MEGITTETEKLMDDILYDTLKTCPHCMISKEFTTRVERYSDGYEWKVTRCNLCQEAVEWHLA